MVCSVAVSGNGEKLSFPAKKPPLQISFSTSTEAAEILPRFHSDFQATKMPALKGTVTRFSTDTDTEPEPFPISTGIPFCQGRFCRSCTSSDRPDIVPPPRCSLDRTQRQTTLTAALFCFFQNSKPNANSANPVASSLLYAIFPGLSISNLHQSHCFNFLFQSIPPKRGGADGTYFQRTWEWIP